MGLKSGERIRLVDETPFFKPLTKVKYSQFDIGSRPDESQLAPFVAKINARADELIKLQPPMRSSYRMESEVDKELNARKEERKQLMALSEENPLRHIYSAEMAALTQKAEDLLIKPTYMPKTVVGVPQNPFKSDDDKAVKAASKPKKVRDEEIEDLLEAAEAKMASIKSNPKDFV